MRLPTITTKLCRTSVRQHSPTPGASGQQFDRRVGWVAAARDGHTLQCGVERVASSDGTAIAYERSGSGPPLVLVHGTSVERFSFRFVEPLLSERFTVYAIDRRGRGESGDSRAVYSIEQEFADIAAVVDSLAEPADLFGHSYGATVALGAASLAGNLRRLILYEPAPGVPQIEAELLSRLDVLLAKDEREQLLSAFLTEAGLDSGALDRLRASPVWEMRVASAHTIPRELRAEESYRPDPDTFSSLSLPVLLLLGSESPEWAKRGTEVAESALAESRVKVLEGEGHLAIMTAPELVAGAVARFLTR
jgi:pimeloyl-ACP methyl ester carboxylesterase